MLNMAKHLRDFYKEIQNMICVIYIHAIHALWQHTTGAKLNFRRCSKMDISRKRVSNSKTISKRGF